MIDGETGEGIDMRDNALVFFRRQIDIHHCTQGLHQPDLHGQLALGGRESRASHWSERLGPQAEHDLGVAFALQRLLGPTRHWQLARAFVEK